jgi:hypothetical protein
LLQKSAGSYMDMLDSMKDRSSPVDALFLQARVWTSPQGTILCCDVRFRDWFGMSGEAVVGKPCHSLGKEPEALSM